MPYPGGKNGPGVYQKIINHMPPHETYIEPFLGGGAVMRLKRPAQMNIGMDLSEASIAEFSGIGRVGGLNVIHEPGAGSAAFRNGEVSSFRFECRDGLEFLDRASSDPKIGAGTLIYCDPPYLMSTRKGRKLYDHEMPDVDHRCLLRCCRDLAASGVMVMISGYWSEMYAGILADWNVIQFEAMTRGGWTATEWLWFSFPPPVELHDYRYLGENFRERERIKRKKQRWTARLARMPVLERQALFAALEETQRAEA